MLSTFYVYCSSVQCNKYFNFSSCKSYFTHCKVGASKTLNIPFTDLMRVSKIGLLQVLRCHDCGLQTIIEKELIETDTKLSNSRGICNRI